MQSFADVSDEATLRNRERRFDLGRTWVREVKYQPVEVKIDEETLSRLYHLVEQARGPACAMAATSPAAHRQRANRFASR